MHWWDDSGNIYRENLTDFFKALFSYSTIFINCDFLNHTLSVLMRWMKLEPIIQSEVSQKEKHQYSILTHIYGI